MHSSPRQRSVFFDKIVQGGMTKDQNATPTVDDVKLEGAELLEAIKKQVRPLIHEAHPPSNTCTILLSFSSDMRECPHRSSTTCPRRI